MKMEVIDIGLDDCPFCHQEAQFGKNLGSGFYELWHHPSGTCPARTWQYMGAELEEAKAFALKFWQWREKNGLGVK